MLSRDQATSGARSDDVRDRLLASLDGDEARMAIACSAPLAPSLAGSALERIVVQHTLPSGASWRTRHVVKHLLPRHGWLGAATHDTRIREAQLARSGLLDDLPHALATPIRAVRMEGDPTAPTAAGLLMDDVTPYLIGHAIGGASGRVTGELRTLLDGLAQLHACFWCDPRLHDPMLGLVTPRDVLLLSSPAVLGERIAAGDENPYLPLALGGWDTFFALATPDDAATLQAVLRDPAPVLRAVEALPWTLVHGDVWGPNLGWLPVKGVRRTPLGRASVRRPPLRTTISLTPRRYVSTRLSVSPWAYGKRGRGGEDHRLLLLDWALAAAASATYDPLWLCGTTHALDPVAVLSAYRPRLELHLRARGIRLSPADWRALVDAGYLRTALTCGEALGRAAAEAPPGAARRRAEARVRWWARRAAWAAHALLGV